jgi:signal transduction histidine kinase
MSLRGVTAPHLSRASTDTTVSGRWPHGLQRLAHPYGYAVAVVLASVATLVGLPGTAPASDQMYAPLTLAFLAGLLLTVRLTPNRPSSSLVVLPAMALYARYGLAALPAVAFAALLVNLVRGLPGPRILSTAGHQVLAFAAAAVSAQAITVVPDWIVFAVVFACGRLALWHLAARLDVSPPAAREEKPEILLSLPLAPIGVLPLLAGEWLGDGALLLASAALLALLLVVREAANLATARSEMEGERDKLARANALQDDLMNLITHELRNPLTLVMSYAQMTRRAAADQAYDQIPTYISHVERAGKSIQRLMENLLQLSQLERSDELPAAEAVQVSSIMNQVIADLWPLAKQKQQTLTVEPADDLEPALAVPLLLREALSNLVSNAVKYTPEGGEIRVGSERGRAPHTVVLRVGDTGIGLSEDDQARLFSKFFRSADPRVQRERGTGLGLALTHALVTRMGGTISVESEPGRGTTFLLTLPSAPLG